MSARNYPRLSIEDFGHATLRAHDLDPVYDALNAMPWGEEQRDRWLLAYWLCYHPGAACFLSEFEGREYWSRLKVAAENQVPAPTGDRWPRAPERRHWRGTAAINSVHYLREKYETATDMVMYCAGGNDGWSNPEPFDAVQKRVREHFNFGSWIAYKVADMLERCCGVPVKFEQADAMYDSPREAAIEVWLNKAGLAPGARPKDEVGAINTVVDHLLKTFVVHPAPGGGGRYFGYQEAETVLCKWKSHMSGHYPLHNDLIEIRNGYLPWCEVSATARAFDRVFPKLPGADNH